MVVMVDLHNSSTSSFIIILIFFLGIVTRTDSVTGCRQILIPRIIGGDVPAMVMVIWMMMIIIIISVIIIMTISMIVVMIVTSV